MTGCSPTFVRDCIRESIPLWEASLNTPFLQQLAAGTLDPNCFKGYLVDDSLYLREYVKVFAWGMLHAETMAEMKVYYDLLNFVNEAEDSTRKVYLRQYGLSDEQIQSLPLRRENQLYIDCMITAAREGKDSLDCLMACLPCMVSYCWIFRRLVRQHPEIMETEYCLFVKDYIDPHYEQVCDRWIDFAQSLCANRSSEELESFRQLFLRCSAYEYDFWLMCQTPRDDI